MVLLVPERETVLEPDRRSVVQWPNRLRRLGPTEEKEACQ